MPVTLPTVACDVVRSTVTGQSVVPGENAGTRQPAVPLKLIETLVALVDPVALRSFKPVSMAVMADTPVPPQAPRWDCLLLG